MKLGHDPAYDIPAAFGKIVNDPQAIRLLHAGDAISSRSRIALLEIAEELSSQRQPKRAHTESVVKLDASCFDKETG